MKGAPCREKSSSSLTLPLTHAAVVRVAVNITFSGFNQRQNEEVSHSAKCLDVEENMLKQYALLQGRRKRRDKIDMQPARSEGVACLLAIVECCDCFILERGRSMFLFQRPLHLACSLACVRIPVNISPSQQARDISLMRLTAGLIGAEAIERLELTIAPKRFGKLVRLLTVS